MYRFDTCIEKIGLQGMCVFKGLCNAYFHSMYFISFSSWILLDLLAEVFDILLPCLLQPYLIHPFLCAYITTQSSFGIDCTRFHRNMSGILEVLTDELPKSF